MLAQIQKEELEVRMKGMGEEEQMVAADALPMRVLLKSVSRRVMEQEDKLFNIDNVIKGAEDGRERNVS